MEFNRSKWIESIYIPFYSILPIVGSLIPVLAPPDTEIPFQTLPISKIFVTLSLHETCSDLAIKTSLGSARCPLQRIKVSAKSAHAFLERWAPQLSNYRGSETGQISVV